MDIQKDDFQQEGIDVDKLSDEDLKDLDKLAEKQDALPADSQSEKKDETETPPSQEGGKGDEDKDKGKPEPPETPDEDKNVPFHKHPRFQELIKERDEGRQKIENLEEQLQDINQKLDKTQDQPSPIPEWFSKLYGDDEQAWRSYEQATIAERKAMKSEIVKEIEEEQTRKAEQQKKAEDEANTYIENSLASLSAEGKKFERKDFMNVMYKYQPTDEQGNLDFDKGYEIYEMVKNSQKNPEKNLQRKQLADKTTPEPKSPEPEKKPYKTTKDLRGKSFASLISDD